MDNGYKSRCENAAKSHLCRLKFKFELNLFVHEAHDFGLGAICLMALQAVYFSSDKGYSHLLSILSSFN